jgi:hypothetical protein
VNVKLQPMVTVSSAVGVREVREDVRVLTTIDKPDYVDLFTIKTPKAQEWSAERWMRAILEEAPLSLRNARRLWRIMGLRLGPRSSPDHVQGWRIAARGDTWIRAETSCWYLTAQAICLVEEAQVLVSLSLRYDRPLVAVPVWTLVCGPHQRALPAMLRQAVRIVTAESQPYSFRHLS